MFNFLFCWVCGKQALDLKKMQTPLYEEFYNSMNTTITPVGNENKENLSNNLHLPPKSSRSPIRRLRKRLSSAVDISSPGNNNNYNSESLSRVGGVNDQNPHEIRSPQNDSQVEAISPRFVTI